MKISIGSVIVLATLFLTTTNADLSDGLVAYYPLDGNARDLSGNQLHGSLIGNIVPAIDHCARTNGALAFPGTAAYVATPTIALSPNRAFSFSAWICPEAGGRYNDYRVFTFKNGWTQISLGLIQAPVPNGRLGHVITYFHTSIHTAIYANCNFEYGQWYLYSATYDGQILKVYVNDKLVDSLKTTQSVQFSAPVFIGGTPEDVYFKGRLEECRIYNRALTAWEIAELATDNHGSILQIGFSPCPRGPWSYTQFTGNDTFYVSIANAYFTNVSDKISVVLSGLGKPNSNRPVGNWKNLAIPMTRQPNGSFTGSTALSAFAPGKVAVIISGQSREKQNFSSLSTITLTAP